MNFCPKYGSNIFFSSFIFILFWTSGIYLRTKCAKITRGWYLTGIQAWAFTRILHDSSSPNLPNQHLLVSSSKKYIKCCWFPEAGGGGEAFNGGGIVKYNFFWKKWDSTKHGKMGTECNVIFTSNNPIWQRIILPRRVAKLDWIKHRGKYQRKQYCISRKDKMIYPVGISNCYNSNQSLL